MSRKHWSVGDRRAVAEAAVYLVATRVALAILPFRTVQRMTQAAARHLSAKATHSTPDDATLARAVRRAAKLLPRSRCLPQALTGLLIAARRGIPARVHIGVRRDAAEPFGAHAWLETTRGIPIGGEEAASFAPLLTVDPFAGRRDAHAWR